MAVSRVKSDASSTQWTILNEVGCGGSRVRKRGWVVPEEGGKWRERVEVLSSTPKPALLSLVFVLGDLGDLTS